MSGSGWVWVWGGVGGGGGGWGGGSELVVSWASLAGPSPSASPPPPPAIPGRTARPTARQGQTGVGAPGDAERYRDARQTPVEWGTMCSGPREKRGASETRSGNRPIPTRLSPVEWRPESSTAMGVRWDAGNLGGAGSRESL